MQVFLPANTSPVEFMAKVHPVQKGMSTAGWRGSRYAHPRAQSTAPGGKIAIQIISGSQGNGTETTPGDPSRTASVLHKREQILTGLQRGSSAALQGTAEDLDL